MRRLQSVVTTYGIVFALLVIALTGAFLGYYRGDTQLTRAGVFFLVASVLFAELFAMVARTKEGTWDGVAASMAFFRAAVVNYIASLAVSLGGFGLYPEWWWSASRIAMGATAAVALFFMAKEDVLAWHEMGKMRRVRALAAGFGYIVAIIVVAFIW